MSDVLVGIDLGTTHSLVGAVVDGRVQLFEGSDGSPLLPSVVGVASDGSILVGREARNRRLLDPEGTVRSIKRRMGRDEEVRLGRRTLSPPEISAQILAALLDRAEEALGVRPPRAVITVPAYFDDNQRQATKDAAEIAGLEVARLVNEPTAAALTHQSGGEELVLVYDLGGGTFDVSILERDEGFMEVRASQGDTQLGGDDVDAALLERVLERLGADRARVAADPHAMTLLGEAVERAKIELSSRETTRIHEPFLAGEGADTVNLDLELSRAEVEEVATPLIERTLPCIERALDAAGVAVSDLDRILLVGGASRMPLVRRLVEARLDMPVQLVEAPDRAVARGAALLAGRMGGAEVDEVLVDITPFTLAAGVLDDADDLIASAVIEQGTVIPTERTATYHTCVPDQKAIEIPITQGEGYLAEDNAHLGDLEIEDLPPSRRGSPVDVVFRLDLSGVLHVSATHRPSGHQATATIKHGPSRLTEQRREAARERHEALRRGEPEPTSAEASSEPAPAAPLRLARSILRRSERALSGEDVPDALRHRVEAAAEALRNALEGEADAEALTERAEALSDALYELS
jgi:molecular chaperone DnaK